MININTKPIDQYDKQWNFIKSWNSLTEVKNTLWYSQSCISHSLTWRNKTSHWYIWKYSDKIPRYKWMNKEELRVYRKEFMRKKREKQRLEKLNNLRKSINE